MHQHLIKNFGIDDVFLCPHQDSDKCKCRKPKIGLIKAAIKKYKIDVSRSFVIGDRISDILMAKLDRKKIAVSNGSACNTGNIKPSNVLKAMGIKNDLNLSTLRFSFGKNNTKDEIDKLLHALKEIIWKKQ